MGDDAESIVDGLSRVLEVKISLTLKDFENGGVAGGTHEFLWDVSELGTRRV